MDELPNELLQTIFSFLSQRYVFVCSEVCKAWLLAVRDPLFYKKIILYSQSQLTKFLEIATTLKITTVNIPIGELVYDLNIKEACYYSNIDIKQLEYLYHCCPNLKNIVGLEKTTKSQQSLPHWSYLTTIPYWYSITDPSLSFHNKRNSITSLEYYIRYINNNNNQDIIQIKMDQDKRSRPKKYYQRNQQIVRRNNQGYVEHYGISLLFFPFASSWIQLESLSLSFNIFNIGSSTAMYALDERVFTIIQSACPQLTSLTLKEFYMNLSDNYQLPTPTLSQITNKKIYPHLPLQQLHFIQSSFNDDQCFSFLSQFYPNTVDLKLDLIWNGRKKEEGQRYKVSLFNMIACFSGLKKLSIQLHNANRNRHISIMKYIWPGVELYEWFAKYPKQLEELDYPYGLLSIENQYLKHLQSLSPSSSSSSSSFHLPIDHLNQALAYLHHLTTLTLHPDENPSLLLHYLQVDGQFTQASLSITSLTLCKAELWRDHYYNDYDFFIYQWLNAFPNLKKLDIANVGNIVKVKEDDNHKRKRNHDGQQQQQQQQVNYFALEELKIKGVNIHLNSDQLKEFFQSCPSLHILTLDSVNFIGSLTTLEPFMPSILSPISHSYHHHHHNNNSSSNVKSMTIDMSHLHLDKLEFLYLQSEYRVNISIPSEPVRFMVKENMTTISTPVGVSIHCKSVDNFRFTGFHL